MASEEYEEFLRGSPPPKDSDEDDANSRCDGIVLPQALPRVVCEIQKDRDFLTRGLQLGWDSNFLEDYTDIMEVKTVLAKIFTSPNQSLVDDMAEIETLIITRCPYEQLFLSEFIERYLKNLKQLRLEECNRISVLFGNQSDKLKTLETLEIRGTMCYQSLDELQQEISKLPNLKRLRLASPRLSIRPSYSIGLLAGSLVELVIEETSFIVVLPAQFLSLQQLELLQLKDLPELVRLFAPTTNGYKKRSMIRKDMLPNLRDFRIVRCGKLNTIPVGIRQFQSLKHLALVGMRSNVVVKSFSRPWGSASSPTSIDLRASLENDPLHPSRRRVWRTAKSHCLDDKQTATVLRGMPESLLELDLRNHEITNLSIFLSEEGLLLPREITALWLDENPMMKSVEDLPKQVQNQVHLEAILQSYPKLSQIFKYQMTATFLTPTLKYCLLVNRFKKAMTDDGQAQGRSLPASMWPVIIKSIRTTIENQTDGAEMISYDPVVEPSVIFSLLVNRPELLDQRNLLVGHSCDIDSSKKRKRGQCVSVPEIASESRAGKVHDTTKIP